LKLSEQVVAHIDLMGAEAVHTVTSQLAHINRHVNRQVDEHAFASTDGIGTVQALPIHIVTLEANKKGSSRVSVKK